MTTNALDATHRDLPSYPAETLTEARLVLAALLAIELSYQPRPPRARSYHPSGDLPRDANGRWLPRGTW